MPTYKFIGCLDFEANCIDGSVIYPQEIIEFPIVVYDVENDTIDRSKDFHFYCKTQVSLTSFCTGLTGLTGITQDMVDNGEDFLEVLDKYIQWMILNGFTEQNFVLVCCGQWDLLTALPNHCKYLGVKVPSYFSSWCNFKEMHRKLFKEKIHGMNNLMQKYGLEFEGRPHSGIVDAYNLTRVVQKYYQKGNVIEITSKTKKCITPE
jgi:inhibitor of KinA sporulation pathway (predicted exonuclease)